MTSSLPELDARAVDVGFDADNVWVDLADGRKVVVPLAWFPRLFEATPAQRENWELLGDGQGIHWPDVDEDLSVRGILQGQSASSRPKRAG